MGNPIMPLFPKTPLTSQKFQNPPEISTVGLPVKGLRDEIPRTYVRPPDIEPSIFGILGSFVRNIANPISYPEQAVQERSDGEMQIETRGKKRRDEEGEQSLRIRNNFGGYTQSPAGGSYIDRSVQMGTFKDVTSKPFQRKTRTRAQSLIQPGTEATNLFEASRRLARERLANIAASDFIPTFNFGQEVREEQIDRPQIGNSQLSTQIGTGYNNVKKGSRTNDYRFFINQDLSLPSPPSIVNEKLAYEALHREFDDIPSDFKNQMEDLWLEFPKRSKELLSFHNHSIYKIYLLDGKIDREMEAMGFGSNPDRDYQSRVKKGIFNNAINTVMDQRGNMANIDFQGRDWKSPGSANMTTNDVLNHIPAIYWDRFEKLLQVLAEIIYDGDGTEDLIGNKRNDWRAYYINILEINSESEWMNCVVHDYHNNGGCPIQERAKRLLALKFAVRMGLATTID
jgi:hypothetical protein